VIATLRRLFAWNAVANRGATAAVAAAGSPAAALRTLAHIVGGERLWLSRLEHVPSHPAVWPALTAAQCADEGAALARAWTERLAMTDERGLAERVAYVNSKGEAWENSVGDVLLHVVLHSAYHRGQVASAVRAAGGTPAYTDFIQAVRTGAIAE
jgi:uncharacterized damage-inducible protein DinB